MVFKSKDEGDAQRTDYSDSSLARTANQHHDLFTEIYKRCQQAGIDVVPKGMGFVSVTDEGGKKYSYLLVEIRPPHIVFNEKNTSADSRFNEVSQNQFENSLEIMKAEDLQSPTIDGLAFSIYWPVRDYAKCDQNGGFLEYITIYFSKKDFINLKNRSISFRDAVANSIVTASLELKPARTMKVVKP